MEQIAVSEFQNSPLPDKLPDGSRLRVWVRSTGYEVRFAQDRQAIHPLLWLLAITSAAALAYFLIEGFSGNAPYNQLAWLLPVLIAASFVSQRFFTRPTDVRLDVSPMTIVISYLGNGDRTETQEHVPLKEIQSFSIDNTRGLGLNITISEILHRTWIGSGLPRYDLQYLAALIVNSGKLSMQRPHPGAL
ncbi:MAG: hypothetical protein R3188_02360 [Acidiferrobacterales bacterium]|nr:hypothetical protein [Acidiferrobacterales bacterium]